MYGILSGVIRVKQTQSFIEIYKETQWNVEAIPNSDVN